MLDLLNSNIRAELYLNEDIFDATFLHDHTFFAAAQKKYIHIYDASGTEVHVLRKHLKPLALDFLPFHFLLTSIGETGHLRYHDTSTGMLVAEHRTRMGSCRVMRQNPYNAVMCLGHSKGVVSLWTPNMNEAVVKMMCHPGGVRAICVDQEGKYMVTAGMDARVKVRQDWLQECHRANYTVAGVGSKDI